MKDDEWDNEGSLKWTCTLKTKITTKKETAKNMTNEKKKNWKMKIRDNTLLSS